jgi:exopolysaccharide biosynthesis polyprenyl glycosylphosphotransferase
VRRPRGHDGARRPPQWQPQSGERVYLTRRLVAPAVDIAMLAAGALAIHFISPTPGPTGEVPPEPVGWLIAFSLLVIALLTLRGMYSPPMRLELLEEMRLVVSGTAVAATALLTLRVMTTNEPWVAAETVRQWALVTPLLMAGRGAVLFSEIRARRKGAAGWATLIIGAGRIGHLTAKRLLDEPEMGLRPVGFLDGDPLDMGDRSTHLPLLGGDGDLDEVVSSHRVRHAIITFSTASHESLLALVRRCWQLGVTVSVVPRLFEIEGERASTERLGGLPLVGIKPANPNGWQFAAKYALDRLASFVSLVLLLPLLALLALAVRITMGSPVFYRQRRVGRDGHEFEMLKFRTMRSPSTDGEEADADWALEQLHGAAAATSVRVEDRLTPLGRFLRRSSLDELPQLWNVLHGDMSLIGPRPERVSYVQRFDESVYRYSDRHRVKSGLTGWAQVNGLRGKTSLADRVEWDNYYIENWSLWLDFKILLRTIARVPRGQPEGQRGQ